MDGADKLPKWDETFTFSVRDDTQLLKVEIHGSDPTKDDLLGGVDVQVPGLMCASSAIDEWYTILYEGESAGQVHLKTVWTPSHQQAAL